MATMSEPCWVAPSAWVPLRQTREKLHRNRQFMSVLTPLKEQFTPTFVLLLKRSWWRRPLPPSKLQAAPQWTQELLFPQFLTTPTGQTFPARTEAKHLQQMFIRGPTYNFPLRHGPRRRQQFIRSGTSTKPPPHWAP